MPEPRQLKGGYKVTQTERTDHHLLIDKKVGNFVPTRTSNLAPCPDGSSPTKTVHPITQDRNPEIRPKPSRQPHLAYGSYIAKPELYSCIIRVLHDSVVKKL
ncbi:hypothetical protein FLAG1_05282 [Fusarium langsethiae]|uniref:Uncharacterized protein n=1 Tax=Fusarium langsethiae TaxID=179993 RepID=A0A0M9EY04_FUSLA|nr:hypothetical protein FLAG1_05282 [Fusarium langsethiae]